MSESSEMYDAARFTLRAIIPVLAHQGTIFNEEPPTDTLHSWVTRLSMHVGSTVVAWHVVCDEDGVADISRSVSFLTEEGEPIEHAQLLAQVDLTSVGVVGLSKLICIYVIGHDYVPMKTRAEAKDWVRVARQDADYIYRTGMSQILRTASGASEWSDSDDPEKWDFLHNEAEEYVGHALGRHKDSWRKAGVIFASADVYDDAFHERAVELLNTITGGN